MKRRTLLRLVAALAAFLPFKALARNSCSLKRVRIDKCNLLWLWVEDEAGNRVEVNCRDGSTASPETHPYAWSRFPNEVVAKCHSRRVDGGYGDNSLIAGGGSSFNEALTLALATGANGQKQYRLYDAILIASSACARCMNAMAYAYGVGWGYSETSQEFSRSRTRCDMCRHLD